MIIDHIGYFLYPGIMRLRVIGRTAFPLFFMLIGRNRSGKIGLSLIIGAVLVQGSLRYLSYTKGYDLRQLNILPAAIIVKLLMDIFTKLGNRIGNLCSKITPANLNPLVHIKPIIIHLARLTLLVTCVALTPLLKGQIEYGTMILGTAITGRLLRDYHKQRQALLVPATLSFVGRLRINNAFPFSNIQRIIVCIIRTFNLYAIRNISKNNKTIHIGIFDNLILFISKQAVRIYIIHFLFLLWHIVT